jgi:hypothetical protein
LRSSLLVNSAPLPAAAAFVDIDNPLQSEFSATTDEAAKVPLPGVSLASLDGTPSISDEAMIGIEDPGSIGEDCAADTTVLADGVVLTANEIEEVLRDAFAETDQMASGKNTREDVTPVSERFNPNLLDTSLFYTVIGCHSIYQGASSLPVIEAGHTGHDRRDFRGRGIARRRTGDQGS